MQKLLFLSLVILLFSCHSKEKSLIGPRIYKLISSFKPAFDEASEITFEQASAFSRLKILIRKNFRIDHNEDTFYYKSITLDSNQISLIQNNVLNRFKIAFPQKESTLLDGMKVYYQCIFNQDTASYSFHSPTKERDSLGNAVTSAIFDTYQSIFRDTIVSDYFNDLRTSIGNRETIAPLIMTPLKLYREKKYAGLMKYSR